MCFNPLIRVDERLLCSRSSIYRTIFDISKKRPYRGAYFFDFEKIFLNIDKHSDARNKLLDTKGVDLIPCGRCKMCLLKYSRDWSIRTYLQSLQTEPGKTNYFITLTYDDLFLNYKEFANKDTGEIFLIPELQKVHIQKFLKRFRKRFGDDIKYYICGEYGPMTHRPHYHMILLNVPYIMDLEFLTANAGNTFYTSPTLTDLWSYGFHSISECNINTIFYTSHYCLKKSGKPRMKVYDINNNIFQGEFQLMSRRPGLGEFYLKEKLYDLNSWVVSSIKLKDITFNVQSLKYYSYLIDKFDVWCPDKKPVDRSRVELLYNNRYLLESEINNFKQAIINTENKIYRNAI